MRAGLLVNGCKTNMLGVCVCARRMSAKMFKCTPEQLPADLKANLLAMLQCGVNALEGYIRPGCVHLTLHAMLGPDAGAALQAGFLSVAS